MFMVRLYDEASHNLYSVQVTLSQRGRFHLSTKYISPLLSTITSESLKSSFQCNHTFVPTSLIDLTRVDGSSLIKNTNEQHLRALSFNIWHTNPPSWAYHYHPERYDRYRARMEYLIKSIQNQVCTPKDYIIIHLFMYL